MLNNGTDLLNMLQIRYNRYKLGHGSQPVANAEIKLGKL